MTDLDLSSGSEALRVGWASVDRWLELRELRE